MLLVILHDVSKRSRPQKTVCMESASLERLAAEEQTEEQHCFRKMFFTFQSMQNPDEGQLCSLVSIFYSVPLIRHCRTSGPI